MRAIASSIVTSLLSFMVNGEYISNCGLASLIWHDDAPLLLSVCRTETGRIHNQCAAIDLNKCYENSHGVLKASKDGKYGLTCKDCSLKGEQNKILTCMCLVDGKDLQYTEIDTNNDIENSDGYLTCFGEGAGLCP